MDTTLAAVMALRPKAQDSASLSAAIVAAEAAHAAATQRAGDLARQSDAALLTATDSEIMDIETATAQARTTADRITALLAEMRTAHADALRREEQDALRQQIDDANARQRAFVAAWPKYVKAAPVIRDVMALAAAASQASKNALFARDMAAGRGLPLDGLPAIEFPQHEMFGGWSRCIEAAVQLPGPAGELEWGAFHYPAEPPLRKW